MFVEWSKAMSYPICVFHVLSYEDGHLKTSCGYPFMDIKECLYEKNGKCTYKMTIEEVYRDWVKLKIKYDLGGKV